MQFLRVNVTFYDAVNMIHDVITTAKPLPYTAKFILVGVRNNKTCQMLKDIEYVYSVAVYQKYLTVGRNDDFLAKAKKLLILPTSLDIFDIR